MWVVFSLGLFINKSAMNISVHFLHRNQFAYLWNKCPRMQLLGWMLSSLLVLKWAAKVFSRVAEPLSIPRRDMWIIQLPHILPSICCQVCFHQCVWFLGRGCSTCKILVPRPGIKSVLSARKVESSNHWIARESLNVSVFLGKKKKRLKWHTLMTLTTLGGCKWFSLVSLNFWPWIYAAFVTRKKKVTVLFKKLLGHSWHRTTSKHNKGSYRL